MLKYFKTSILITLILFTFVFVSFQDANATTANSEADAVAVTGDSSAVAGDSSVQIGNIGSNNTSTSPRNFAIPGNAQYGPVVNYFGQPLPSEGFQPIEQLIMYGGCFTEGALESMLKDAELGINAEFKVASENFIPAGADENGVRWIKIIVQLEPVKSTQFVGFVTARSNSEKTTMVEVMAKAALTALRQGCNVIHFTAQGAVRDTFAKGWGIGFSHTNAYIADQQDRSNVSTGGFGYSSAKAGMRDKPWLQGFGLIDHDLKFPETK